MNGYSVKMRFQISAKVRLVNAVFFPHLNCVIGGKKIVGTN